MALYPNKVSEFLLQDGWANWQKLLLTTFDVHLTKIFLVSLSSSVRLPFRFSRRYPNSCHSNRRMSVSRRLLALLQKTARTHASLPRQILPRNKLELAKTSALSKWHCPCNLTLQRSGRSHVRTRPSFWTGRRSFHDYVVRFSVKSWTDRCSSFCLVGEVLSDWHKLVFRSRSNSFVDSLAVLQLLDAACCSPEEESSALFLENIKIWRWNSLFVRPWLPGSRDALEPLNTLFCLDRFWPEVQLNSYSVSVVIRLCMLDLENVRWF